VIGRRNFIAMLGGAAAWPLAARGQQPDRMRRVGILMNDPEGQARHATFLQGLQQSGWTVGRNVRIDIRWGRTMPTGRADTRKNWSRSHRTSSWRHRQRDDIAAFHPIHSKGVSNAKNQCKDEANYRRDRTG